MRSALAGLLGVALLAGCVPQQGPTSAPESTTTAPATGPTDWPAPGLTDRSGEPVEVPVPGPASGSSLEVTGFGADPEPDSGDDAPALRAALDAAEPGDEVVLPEGTFDLRSTDPDDDRANLMLRSGIDLRGQGPGRTTLITGLDGEEDSRVLHGSGLEDVRVTGLAITSRHEGPLGEDTDDGGAGGGPMFGVYLGTSEGKGSARILVEDLDVRRFQRHGISVKGGREVTLRGNHVAEATAVGPGGQGYGIAIEGFADQDDPEAANDSRHHQVIGNTFDGRHLRHAILLQFPTHHNLVADNVITDSLLDAIDLHGEGEYLNEIRGNTVLGGRRAGIALGNPGGSTNQHDASGRGNWVHGNELTGNREGVLIMLGTPDTVIEDNRIRAGDGSRAGVEVRNGPGTVVRDNTVTGGLDEFWSIRLAEDAGTDGRGAGVPEGVLIEGNVMRQVSRGIRVSAGEDVTVTGNVFEDVRGTELSVADGAEVDRTEQP